jgi:hypothetical protein
MKGLVGSIRQSPFGRCPIHKGPERREAQRFAKKWAELIGSPIGQPVDLRAWDGVWSHKSRSVSSLTDPLRMRNVSGSDLRRRHMINPDGHQASGDHESVRGSSGTDVGSGPYSLLLASPWSRMRRAFPPTSVQQIRCAARKVGDMSLDASWVASGGICDLHDQRPPVDAGSHPPFVRLATSSLRSGSRNEGSRISDRS